MTDQEFFEFALDEYRAELALAHALYQRAAFALTAAVILAGATFSLGRIDLLRQTLQTLDVFLLQAATVLALAFLLLGLYFIFAATLPRKYPKLTKPFFWDHWRREYWAALIKDDPENEERNQRCLAEATRAAMLERLLDSQARISFINQKRQRAFQKAIFLLALAAPALGVQAASAAWVHWREDNNVAGEVEKPAHGSTDAARHNKGP